MKAFIVIRKTYDDFVIEGAFKTEAIANTAAADPDYPSCVYEINFDESKVVKLTEEFA